MKFSIRSDGAMLLRLHGRSRTEALEILLALSELDVPGFCLTWATMEKHHSGNRHHVAGTWRPIARGNVRYPAEGTFLELVRRAIQGRTGTLPRAETAPAETSGPA